MAEVATERVRHLNDTLRRTGLGGTVLVTRGLQGLGDEMVARVVQAVRGFDAFTADNDPHGEHDCATMQVEGTDIIWKIDYYDLAGEYHSPDPANPEVTRRVLTILLAEEY